MHYGKKKPWPLFLLKKSSETDANSRPCPSEIKSTRERKCSWRAARKWCRTAASCRSQAEEGQVGVALVALRFSSAVSRSVLPLHLPAGPLRGRQQETKTGEILRRDQRRGDRRTGNALDGGVARAAAVCAKGARWRGRGYVAYPGSASTAGLLLFLAGFLREVVVVIAGESATMSLSALHRQLHLHLHHWDWGRKRDSCSSNFNERDLNANIMQFKRNNHENVKKLSMMHKMRL